MTPAELRAARTSSGLTQPEWGYLLGVTRSQIAKIESGASRPSTTLVLMAHLVMSLGLDKRQMDLLVEANRKIAERL